MDKRKFHRIASGVEIGFQVTKSDRASRDYYSGLVENYSFGGLFIATSVPLAIGDVIDLSFDVDGGDPVEARAVVRWVRRWIPPRGAGVEFIEFNNLGDREVTDVLGALFESSSDDEREDSGQA